MRLDSRVISRGCWRELSAVQGLGRCLVAARNSPPHPALVAPRRTLQAVVNKTRAAYQNAAVAGKKLVEDADKLDIVVKACQTEYIKLKLLNNNAKAYVNAKRLKWQRQADSFRYWAEYVHFETIGAIQVRERESNQPACLPPCLPPPPWLLPYPSIQLGRPAPMPDPSLSMAHSVRWRT